MAIFSYIKVIVIAGLVIYIASKSAQYKGKINKLTRENQALSISINNALGENIALNQANDNHLAQLTSLNQRVEALNYQAAQREQQLANIEQASSSVREQLITASQDNEQTRTFFSCDHGDNINGLLNQTVTASNKNSGQH